MNADKRQITASIEEALTWRVINKEDLRIFFFITVIAHQRSLKDCLTLAHASQQYDDYLRGFIFLFFIPSAPRKAWLLIIIPLIAVFFYIPTCMQPQQVSLCVKAVGRIDKWLFSQARLNKMGFSKKSINKRRITISVTQEARDKFAKFIKICGNCEKITLMDVWINRFIAVIFGIHGLIEDTWNLLCRKVSLIVWIFPKASHSNLKGQRSKIINQNIDMLSRMAQKSENKFVMRIKINVTWSHSLFR